MSIFAKARSRESLSPGQRAFLKLVEGFVVAGVVAALPVLALALAQDNINWSGVGRLALGTFATAALMAAVKYYKAQGDLPLADALATAAGDVSRWAGLNDVGNKPAPTPSVTPAAPATSDAMLAGRARTSGMAQDARAGGDA